MPILPAILFTAPPAMAASAPVWVPYSDLRAFVAGIPPSSIQAIHFGGRWMGALRAGDALTITDSALCAHFLTALQNAELPKGTVGLPGIAENHWMEIEFKQGTPHTPLTFGFNPTDPAFCFGPSMYRLLQTSLPLYQSAAIRRASHEAARKGVVSITFGMLTQEEITDQAEIKQILYALHCVDQRIFVCTGRATGQKSTDRVLPSRVLLHLKDNTTVHLQLAVAPISSMSTKHSTTDALRVLRHYAEETEPQL